MSSAFDEHIGRHCYYFKQKNLTFKKTYSKGGSKSSMGEVRNIAVLKPLLDY